jgi:hypothetical protein
MRARREYPECRGQARKWLTRQLVAGVLQRGLYAREATVAPVSTCEDVRLGGHARTLAEPRPRVENRNGAECDLFQFQFLGIDIERVEASLFGLVEILGKRANRSHRFAEPPGLR